MGVLLTVVLFAAWAYAIYDIARTPGPEVRLLSKWVWIVLVVLCGPLLGPMCWLLWFVFARPRNAPLGMDPGSHPVHRTPPSFGPRPGRPNIGPERRPGTPSFGRIHLGRAPEPERPRGPADDPEFIRQLAEQLRRNPPDG
ncbi:MAG: PLDc_N domain-containing protein, partial [Frankia sp.]|nr:PLDc_N domain-containing protein [Frankia sp.]